jgi:type VI secretion system secreted protein VgrG
MVQQQASSAAFVRNVTVKTALGTDAFELRSFRFRDRLGEPFEGVLELQSDADSIDLGKLLGEQVTVTVPLPGDGKRYFNGIVLEASQEAAAGDTTRYRLVMGPWLALLNLGSDSQIFQQKSAPDILEKVFRGLEFSAFQRRGLIGQYDPLEFCVQYNETHANFVHRLMQRFGIAYHHDHTADSHTLVLCDSPTSYQSNPGYATVPYRSDSRTAKNLEHVSHWTSTKRLRSGKYAAKDYDYLNPDSDLLAQDSATQSCSYGDMELFEYPGGYTKQSLGTRLARVRIEEQACGQQRFEGRAHCWGFAAGKKFELADHPQSDCNRAYLTTAIELSIDPLTDEETATHRSGDAAQFTYVCRLEAIPADVSFRPARTAPQPRIAGVQTAVVVGPPGHDRNVPYTDEHACVRVQFRWDRLGKNDSKSSCWLRHAQPFAGSGWGATFLPLVGCEVVVAFIGGDPDRPLVLSGVYNEGHKPPRDLPAQAVKTIVQDVAGNFLVFDSQASHESITVRTAYRDNFWMIGDCDTTD